MKLSDINSKLDNIKLVIGLSNLGYNDFFNDNLMLDSIILDVCSMCQLRCPVCHVAKGVEAIKKTNFGWGYLKFEDFKNFIDENPQIKQIEFSVHGEIFLNPELSKIIKYAYEKDVILTAHNGVNFNDVSDTVLRYLVEYRFNSITVSIDGASDETYKIYRKGGNFNRVIENIKKLNKYKKIYCSEFPKLKWQFVIFGHNEYELPVAKDMAKRLDMEFIPKLNWDSEYSPVRDKEFVMKEGSLEFIDREEFRKKTKKEYISPCHQLWKNPIINWDGKLLGCCVNFKRDFGNVFKLGLNRCLKSKDYVYMMKVVRGKEKVREDLPCFDCPSYKKILGIK